MSNPNNEMLADMLKRGIIEGLSKLCDRHGPSMIEMMQNDPAEELKIGVSVKFQYGAVTPSIEVGIRYGYAVKDKVISRLPDPQQPEFVFDSVMASGNEN